MLNKKKLNFGRMETFLSKKISANSANTAYTLGLDGPVTEGEPDIMWQTICFIKDKLRIWTGGQLYYGTSKLSELENDSNYATLEYVPTKISLLVDDSDFVTRSEFNEELENISVILTNILGE